MWLTLRGRHGILSYFPCLIKMSITPSLLIDNSGMNGSRRHFFMECQIFFLFGSCFNNVQLLQLKNEGLFNFPSFPIWHVWKDFVSDMIIKKSCISVCFVPHSVAVKAIIGTQKETQVTSTGWLQEPFIFGSGCVCVSECFSSMEFLTQLMCRTCPHHSSEWYCCRACRNNLPGLTEMCPSCSELPFERRHKDVYIGWSVGDKIIGATIGNWISSRFK